MSQEGPPTPRPRLEGSGQAEPRKEDAASEEEALNAQLYSSDDFRIWCMKVIPCTKRFVHDWSVCPFAHAGEKAVRRDPRTLDYTGIACPEMKKTGTCLRGEACPYAHNVFEYWLHPTRYRTQLCNDGPACKRSICFFAHSLDELRTPAVKPYVSPEALARASLEAIHQHPHPLGRTLSNPLRAGALGGMPPGGRAAQPFPGAGAQRGVAGMARGGAAAPWGGGAATGGYAGFPHDPSNAAPLLRPAQPLRPSGDYSRQLGGYGASPQPGPGMGAGLFPQAGGPWGPQAPLGAGLPGTMGVPGLFPSLSPSPALSWPPAPESPRLGGGMQMPTAGGLPFTTPSWAPQGEPLGAPWAPVSPQHAQHQAYAVRAAAPPQLPPFPAAAPPPAGGLASDDVAQAAMLQAMLSGQRLSSGSLGDPMEAGGAGRLSALSDSTMAQAASLLSAGRVSSTNVGDMLGAALSGRLSDGGAAAAQAACLQALAAQGSSNSSGEGLEAALMAQMAGGGPMKQLLSGGAAAATAGAGGKPAGAVGGGSRPQSGGEKPASGPGSWAAEEEQPVSSPASLPPGIPTSVEAPSRGGSGSFAPVAAGPAEPAVPAAPADLAALGQGQGQGAPPGGASASTGAGQAAASGGGAATAEELAQSLASMKIALTQQQVAAAAGTNHEIVISTLHQILRDAAAQQSAAGGRGGQS